MRYCYQGIWTKQSLTRENLDVHKKVNLKRETESLLIVAQNNTIKTNYVWERIDKTQQKCRCILKGDRDETINHIISEYCKLVQREYKTKHDKNEIWELHKFKLNHTNKWYMHNLESFLENETHKILWDFEIQTDHLISARRPDLMIVQKKNPSE